MKLTTWSSLATLVRAISVVRAEAGSQHVDDYTGEREEMETVPAERCLEREQRNVVLAGEGCGSRGGSFVQDRKYYSMSAW